MKKVTFIMAQVVAVELVEQMDLQVHQAQMDHRALLEQTVHQVHLAQMVRQAQVDPLARLEPQEQVLIQ
jgi:hypothetical protein